jgi:hypothetical protein
MLNVSATTPTTDYSAHEAKDETGARLLVLLDPEGEEVCELRLPSDTPTTIRWAVISPTSGGTFRLLSTHGDGVRDRAFAAVDTREARHSVPSSFFVEVTR